MGGFQGFTPETVDFLWGIRFNNNRDWFMAHKDQYTNELYHPMKELAAEIFTPFEAEPGMLCKVSRIYKDARMKPTVPYKESLWICIRTGATWWGEEPSLFFELTPDKYSFGFLLWGPKSDWLERWRKAMADRPEAFLELAAQVERDTGLAITGERYKRPKPCPDERLRPWWDLKHILAVAEYPVDEDLFTPDLADRVRETLVKLKPLYDWCKKIGSSVE